MEKVPTYTYILMYEQYVYLHYIADINFSFEQESQTTQSSRLAGIEEHFFTFNCLFPGPGVTFIQELYLQSVKFDLNLLLSLGSESKFTF